MMLRFLISVLLLFAWAGDELVDLPKVHAGVRLDIRYATTNNFTGKKVYDKAECRLRRPVAEKLAEVQRELEREGLGLKVWDCYRPISVQKKFWELVPDERYVANPAKGSRHNRGAAVDLTLVDRNGRELPMPTGYDDFSERAHRDFRELPADAIRNRERLERVMVKHGFVPFQTEWWHFDFAGWEKYPLIE
jgi:D-alanyl-D-alanine dipeptidase